MSEFLSHDLNMSSLPSPTILATTDIPGGRMAERGVRIWKETWGLGLSGSQQFPLRSWETEPTIPPSNVPRSLPEDTGLPYEKCLLGSSDLQLTAHSKQGKQEGPILFLQKAFHRFATRCRRMSGLEGVLHITFTFVVRSLSQGHRRKPRQLRLLRIGPDQCVVEEVPEPAPPRPPTGYPSRCRSTQIRGCPRNAGKSPGDYCTPLSPCASS